MGITNTMFKYLNSMLQKDISPDECSKGTSRNDMLAGVAETLFNVMISYHYALQNALSHP